jgi:hypothetical protein
MQNNEAATISFYKASIEATSGKYPHFAWHYTLLASQSQKMVPQACLTIENSDQIDQISIMWPK